MPNTVANVEAILLKRCSAAMAVVTLDVTTADGTNPDLADPIRYAAVGIGLWLATPGAVADADLTPTCGPPVAGHRYEKLLDLAELRTLETVLNRFLYVDQKTDVNTKQNNQWRQGLQARIEYLTRRISLPYGRAFGRVRIGRDEPRLRWPRPGADADGDWGAA